MIKDATVIEYHHLDITLEGISKKSQSRYNNCNSATNVTLDKISTYSIKLQDIEMRSRSSYNQR